ncbi:MAG: phosphoribosylglycinamide formyltransferase [Bacteroidaceae bacterium]|jgi:phosphoribosylglycinamide formyltransferase-1
MSKRVAILASGEGTNAENIIRFFKGNPSIIIALVVCNRKSAGVFERAGQLGVETLYLPKTEFETPGKFLHILEEYHIDFIVLSGFLLFVPSEVLRHFHRRIINIHPSLLPKHGGKGMYGDRVHEAVLASGDRETGITIHYANEHYDEGEIIFQAKTPVLPGDTPHDIAQRVHQLEYKYYPEIILKLLSDETC